MRKFFVVCALLTSAFLFSGCYQTTVHTGLTPSGVKRTMSAPHFVNGLTSVELSSQCGDAGVASVTHKIGVLDHILSMITFTLYSPSTVEIECAAK